MDADAQCITRLTRKLQRSCVSNLTFGIRTVSVSYEYIFIAPLNPFSFIRPLQVVHGSEACHVGWDTIGTRKIVAQVLVIIIQSLIELRKHAFFLSQVLFKQGVLIGKSIILIIQLIGQRIILAKLGLLNPGKEIFLLCIILLDFSFQIRYLLIELILFFNECLGGIIR